MGMMHQLRDVSTSLETRGRATEFLRYAIAKAACGVGEKPAEYFSQRWPHSKHASIIAKAAVAPMSTSGTGAPLAELQNHSAALVETLRPLTVLGRMTGFRRVPFLVKFPRITAGTSAQWVGEAAVRPATRMSLDQIEFKQSKISGICVFTKELARNSDPAVEALVRQDITATIAQFSDASFLDPSLAEVENVSPASITNGAPEIVSTGSTADAAAADLRALFAAVTTNLAAPYLIMRPSTAIALAAMGDRFPDVGANGGSIWGTPVIVSANVPADANSPGDDMIILIDAAEILLAEGDVEFHVAEHATLQMDDAPDSPTIASTVMVSLWTHNLVGIGVNRYIRWQRRREGSVAVLTGVQY